MARLARPNLFQVLPRVLAAPDQASADAVMFHWITDLPAITECLRCVGPLPNNVELSPDLDWLSDKTLLGSELSNVLRRIYLNRMPSDGIVPAKVREAFREADPSLRPLA